ncbi:hypothetical protein [Rhodococcus qingshengii]|uniref:hypothetical protein n=1 Tax=Rhodococcus qingshengii TaxID=334542 RepID=UPI001F33EC08|nr:hypothetical protein [Rhodococcus qingshengii]
MSDNPYGLPRVLEKGEEKVTVHSATAYHNLLGRGFRVATPDLDLADDSVATTDASTPAETTTSVDAQPSKPAKPRSRSAS